MGRDHQTAAQDLSFEKTLPASLEAESAVLGSILLNDAEHWEKASSLLSGQSWSLEAHRRIWARMSDVAARGERINRLTLIDELRKQGQLESVGGMSALVDLDAGLPELPNIESYCRIVLEKQRLRELIYVSQRTLDAAFAGAADSQEIATHAAQGLETLQSGAQDKEDGRTPEEIVTNFPGGLSAFLDPTLRKRGLPTGFRKLDEMLGGGLQDGELVIVAARPAVGKSAYMLNVCQHVCMHPTNPQRTDVFSLEMSGESLITRMLCAAARVNAHKFRSGFLSREERAAMQRALYDITQAPLRIHDDFKKTLPGLVRRIRHAHKQGSKLIALDYVQLMVTGGRAENRNLEIGEIGRTLKTLALELHLPIMLLSQIGRSAEKRGGDMRPQLSDLKDSGTLEEHADTVLTLYREELYKKDREDVKGLADMDILKQRNGPTGRVPLRFIHGWTAFENRAEDFPEEPDAPSPQPSFHEGDGW